MKPFILTLGLLLSFITFGAVPFTIQWTFKNVEDGYDHQNKIKIYIDGNYMGESAVFKETEIGNVSINIPIGQHHLRIDNYALYQGIWEAHTVENNYSIDAIYDVTYEFGKKNSLNIVWDVDEKASTYIWNAKNTTTKSKKVNLSVTWKFSNIVEGYDHLCRTKIYVDGVLAGTSKELLESKGGSLKITIPVGTHEIRIVNESFYHGKWEEHTVENDYSVDCTWQETRIFSKSSSISLLFDIEAESTSAIWK